jgi:hypothetical protein
MRLEGAVKSLIDARKSLQSDIESSNATQADLGHALEGRCISEEEVAHLNLRLLRNESDKIKTIAKPQKEMGERLKASLDRETTIRNEMEHSILQLLDENQRENTQNLERGLELDRRERELVRRERQVSERHQESKNLSMLPSRVFAS